MYLIPRPQYFDLKEGNFTVRYWHKITLDASCSYEYAHLHASILQEEFQESAGFAPAITRGISRETAVYVTLDDTLGMQEYRLLADETGVKIAGGSQTGVLYGIQTLRQILRQKGAVIPYMEIRDVPAIENRGFYFDVTRGRIPTMDSLKLLVDKMSLYKLNQLQLYIEHSFLFENMSEVWRDDTPLTPENILELDVYCRQRGVELIPSLSGFGHLYKVLRTRTYRELGEMPEAAGEPFGFVDRMLHHILNAADPQSLEFAKHMIEQYLPLFSSEYFNICADETFDLGKGRSRELAERLGTDRVYMDFVRELCEFVVSKGKKPMFWGDIICKFPQAISELPKETICLNWGYDPDVSENDIRSLAQAGAVQYACPGVSGWNQLVNDIRGSYENISRMCSYAVKYGAVGVLNTDWGDYGHINHPDFSTVGMIYGASFSWNLEIPSFEEMNRMISVLEYSDASGTIVSVLADIAPCQIFSWFDAVYLKEGKKNPLPPKKAEDMRDAVRRLAKIQEALNGLLPLLDKNNRKRMWPYLVALDGIRLLQQVGIVLADFGMDSFLDGKINDHGLACALEKWFYYYKQVWRSVSRESELYRLQEVVFWYADRLRG